MPTKSATRARATTTAHAPKMNSGQTLYTGQQITNELRLEVNKPYSVSLFYKPFGQGDWQTMELPSIVQHAIYSFAQQCGALSTQAAAIDGGTSTAPTRQPVSRARSAPKVSGRAATRPAAAAAVAGGSGPASAPVS
jgi:hypothetical protein